MIQTIRPAIFTDIDRLMEIFDTARHFMTSTGNPNQWINGYPQRELVAEEINQGNCYVCENEENVLVGTFCFVPSFSACLDWCTARASQLRADTHADNKVMQHLLEKHGFVRCGIIYVSNGTPRIAYQRKG